jgi:putative transposase
MYWRWRSRHGGRSKTNAEILDLIRRMSSANLFWSSSHIPGHLFKLGVDVSQATVGRYLPRRPKTPLPDLAQLPAQAPD